MLAPISKRLRYASTGVNVVFDGNSLVSGIGSTGGNTLPVLMSAIAPLSAAGITVTNLGASGQSTRMMDGLDGGSAADVDAAWVNGKTNILFAWEGTNSIYNDGRTAAQAIADMTQYIADRQAVHPWLVILLNTLPRQVGSGSDATQASSNAILDSYNATLASTYKSMGAQRFIDLRQSPYFVPSAYTNAAFETMAANGYWNSGETGIHVHLNSAGYAVVAAMCADALMRLHYRG